ncbi:sugar phosphorylase [Rossellomorea aquimaris]|jgi:glucosylglycerate phosphorylase|uniref:Sucrose phosphorylase n=1 Tax=Rossellomorea aquimaris TaxID=189382 RepID=A0A5D4TMJ2_9BACI|nr:sugar phosphorylase [Rossellomorea aquimaris]TYS76465.1 sugar phosphorylase [Rossellomorea aquimaris]TYS83054.1 sugar phosphorylase [Rossellomorea aquimaris]
MTKQELVRNVEERLKTIYGEDFKEEFLTSFTGLVDKWSRHSWESAAPVSEENVYLITYGDSIYEEGKPTLASLRTFLNEKVKGSITDVHLLPMFPYTSDDGFSVVDYRQVDPKLGDWTNIEELAQDYRLMFDFVANHISKSSAWFQGYINGEERYKEYFVPKNPSFDPSVVVRPRTSPLYHEYEGRDGVKTAWTTFSEDQVDLNFRHFPVLKETTDILLEYASKGGTSIRLDAIGFIWKESGTTSIHLPQAHEIIKLWREVMDFFKPNTQIITETNVPHKENISYFGDGTDEANMVYQFSLPPLVLFSLTTHNGEKLTEWAKTIDTVSDTATYFNFLASHDGIGMRPTEGILTENEKHLLVNKVKENGGRVSYKANSDGSQSVYELNINYSAALVNQGEDTTEELEVKKMLAAHSILLSFVGVPAIYYHSLLGSHNDEAGVASSGINRRINREKLELSSILGELETSSRRKGIFEGLQEMISIRQKESAFSPYAGQEVLELGANLFGLKRFNQETGESITFVVNLDAAPAAVTLPHSGFDLQSGKEVSGEVELNSYEFMWVKQ